MSLYNTDVETCDFRKIQRVEITRDAASVGTAYKTVAMRIRGYDEETQEYTGDIEKLDGTIANLTKTAKTPGGISIFADANKTEFKSTYQILEEISEIYDDLTDKNQANNSACMYRNVHSSTHLKPVKPKALSLQCG